MKAPSRTWGWASAALGLSCAFGCGASGQEWVRAPERGVFDADVEAFGALHAEAPESGDARSDRPPRLSRTVTLGESVGGDPPSTPPASVSTAGVFVTVNNYLVPAPSPAISYDFYDAAARLPSRPRAPAPRSGLPAVGQDWPAPRDSGPPFPYKTAPASPWNGRR